MRDYNYEFTERVRFIRELVEESGVDGIVFGNSGGKDSALVGILCKFACENTVGIMMPCASKVNFGKDMEDAKELAEHFGIENRVIDLTDVRQAEIDRLSAVTRLSNAAVNNIAPRLRMTTLYTIAQSEYRLVAGTGNRSEIYMGYFTKWGDGACDFNPISDLTATEVREFLCWLTAPASIINKAPSAGLFDGQTDEDEMGVSYEAIDKYIKTGRASERDKRIIDRFHRRSAHKRAGIKNYKERESDKSMEKKGIRPEDMRPESMERITTPALAEAFIEEQLKALREQIGDKKVLLALSGGVDSSVVAALLIKAVGKQLTCVHVNHGLLRKGEPEQVVEVFRDQMDANLIYVDAVDRFLDKLAEVSDPEEKRKIIGAEFINVFAEEAYKLDGVEFLAQGTIYPDILESDGVKSHHNVGGLPEDLKFELCEPVKFLYKDEVRMVGKALGLPDSMVFRQPFPGPGLGVRCVGAITRDRLEAVRESDAILREEFAKNGLEGKVWQYFTIVPDFKSTGIKDGKRTFDWPVVIRAVNSIDATSATIEEIPYALLHHIADRITNEVAGVNRVLYDLTPKPVGTIEWE